MTAIEVLRVQPLPDEPATEARRVGLATLFLAYLQVGLTAFGFTMLQKVVQLIVDKKHWLTREQADHGLALVQLYPGPIMVDFTAYVGYRLRGVRGALARDTATDSAV
jgi:chromate transporter